MERFNVGIESTMRSGLELLTPSVKHAAESGQIFVRTAARATARSNESLHLLPPISCGSAQMFLDTRELRAYPTPSLPALTEFLLLPL